MNTARILPVEDEAVTAIDLTDTLKSFGYEVLDPVMSGEKALAVVRDHSPDLVLMDIRLNGAEDGITTAAKIWDEMGVPIVFLTAYSDEETLAKVKLARPFGFILKPFKDRELHAVIQVALENSRQVSKEKKIQIAFNSNSSLKHDSIEFCSSKLTPLDFLKRIDPIRKLPEKAIQELANGCRFQTFSKNETLCHEGDSHMSAFIVASGRIALLKTTSSGKELTVGLLPPGDVFSVAISLDDTPSSYTMVAHGDSNILTMSTTLIRVLLSDFPHLYKEFHEEVKERLDRSHDFSLRLAHESVEVRIATALLELVSDFGSSKQGDDFYIVHVTRQQLAQIAGTTIETAIRSTRSMEKDGILDLSQPALIKIIDLKMLQRISTEIEEEEAEE